MRYLYLATAIVSPLFLTSCAYYLAFGLTQHYVPAKHEFCGSTQTPGWSGVGWIERATVGTHYWLSIDISPLYQYEEEKKSFALNVELNKDWTIISMSGAGKNNLTEPDAIIYNGSLVMHYDPRQAVLEVDGKPYRLAANPQVYEPIDPQLAHWRHAEAQVPFDMKKAQNTYYLGFAVQPDQHSKIKFIPGAAELDGQQVVLPTVDFKYCPRGGHYEQTNWQ